MLNDILPQNPSWATSLFCVLMYLAMFLMTCKLNAPYYNQRVNIKKGWFLIFIFFIFSFYNDDWFSYFEHVKSASFLLGNINNLTGREAMEPLYYYLAFALNGDYLLWRFVIFGSTVLLSYLTAQRLGLNRSFLFTFAIIACPILSYARVSLAIAIAFYGLSLLIRPYRTIKKLSYVGGILIIIISVFFHKSALVLPFLVILPCFYHTTKLKLSIYFLLFFSAIYIFNTTNFITLFLSGEDVQYLVSERSFKYLSAESNLGGIGQFTIRMMHWLSYYLFAILVLLVLWKNKLNNYMILPYANAVVIIIIFSSTFLFVNSLSTFTFFYRYLNFASLPMSVTAAYCIFMGIYRKAFVNVTFFHFLSNIFDMMYSTYSAYVHF